MMNRSQQDRLLPRAKPPEPLTQSWGRPFQARKNGTQCACGGDCPRCLPEPASSSSATETTPGTSADHATQPVETRTTTRPFKAEIRMTAPPGSSATSRGKTVNDSPTDDVVPPTADTPIEEVTATPPPMREQEAPPAPPQGLNDDILYIPQMGGPDAIKDTEGVSDAVGASFNYTFTVNNSGITLGADDFGKTTGSLKHFSNVVVTPGAGKFTVTADLKQTVSWDTRATVGPHNEVNIMSDTDPALTNANYAQVVSDLTPNVSDLKGRPPRTKFWSKDFTIKHEKYHVKDFTDVGQTGATGAETWLGTQTAARKEDVPALLDTAWNDKIFKVWDKFTDPPKVEERAYDDGVASYTARANAIKTKGDKGPTGGGYP